EGDYDIVVEPHRRDTAPAIMLAATYLHSVRACDDEETVIVMPIDSYVDDQYFELVQHLDEAMKQLDSDMVLLGVKPTHPSSKFGYIVPSEDQNGDVWSVASFKEKPSLDEAEELLRRGALWNCGVFAFRLGYLRSVTAAFTDANNYEALCERYDDLPQTSFDYAVVEKAQSVGVIRYEGAWKDLGTWSALTEEMQETEAGRVTSSQVDGTHIVNELNIPLVALGVEDAVIVATPDGILVSSKEASAAMKPLVERASEGRAMYETRNWGDYRVLDHASYQDGSKSLTKHLHIKQGSQISYQRHLLRDEIWTIADGQGEIALDGVVHTIEKGESISISHNQLHAIRALTDLHVIEVQIGSRLTEEDIERFGFYWD
ncbi:MAG: sugar phosphate nucleotidyltransferase, partial [Raoultibacter sp.]